LRLLREEGAYGVDVAHREIAPASDPLKSFSTMKSFIATV
jgi:hypothetical protein